MGEAAVALTLVPDRSGALELLFIKRASRSGDPWSGQMALPGGRREAADVDLLATAQREAHEETGVALSRHELLGALDDLRPVSPHLPQLLVRPFVFGLPSLPEIELSEEVALHLWLPLTALIDSRATETVHVRGRSLTVPGYRIGPHFIWGMTERIVTPLIKMLLK